MSGLRHKGTLASRRGTNLAATGGLNRPVAKTLAPPHPSHAAGEAGERALPRRPHSKQAERGGGATPLDE